MASSYALELKIAELAVRRASILTNNVYHSRIKGTVTKDDKSPVTIADFGAQSLIIGAVLHVFPNDGIVGEEDSGLLREQASTRELVWQLVRDTVEESQELSDEIGAVKDETEMMDLIDRGSHAGGASGRIWALDPIDGTKGFLRGGQYAVCLALMVDGEVVVSAMGCPSLPVDPADASGERGALFSAVKGAGATQRKLSSPPDAAGTPVSMNRISQPSEASVCEGVEAAHSSHSQQAAIAQALGITKEPVRLDSQAKYASLARGAADVYLRLPSSMTYEEKIWDHAAGQLLVEEAGGLVTDTAGKPLDFTLGRTLKANRGVVGAYRAVHAQVIAAVKAELAKPPL